MMEVMLYDRTSIFVSTKKTYWTDCRDNILGSEYSGPCKFGFIDDFNRFAIFPIVVDGWLSKSIGIINVDFFSIDEV